MANSLQITEIYKSIQGESSFVGWPCVFIRLTGCPLRCRWCDTAYGFTGGASMTLLDILEKVKSLNCKLVELTGGEPLAQPHTADLIEKLIALDFNVLIETGGSESIKDLNRKTHIIMDLKCPDSLMSERNLWENLNYLKPTDEIKFVIASRQDFEWAIEKTKQHALDDKFQLLFSPAFGLLQPKDLTEWLLAENYDNLRIQLQIHKYIWSPRAKGV